MFDVKVFSSINTTGIANYITHYTGAVEQLTYTVCLTGWVIAVDCVHFDFKETCNFVFDTSFLGAIIKTYNFTVLWKIIHFKIYKNRLHKLKKNPTCIT